MAKTMRFGSARYTILHLLLLTMLVALYYVAMLTESPWWRATLMTISLCLFLNSIIASIIARGSRQAFALGYMVSTFFYLISLYASLGIETLPFLLTQMLWTKMATISLSPPSEEHFYVIAGLFWAQVFAYTGALMSLRWYHQRMSAAVMTG
jgi:hypothetical protein